MGCPAPKVVKTGAGSALLKDPEKAFAIVSGIKQAVHKPVSVKLRLGYSDSEKNYLSFAKGLEEAGADMIAVHGRTRTQMYQGSADWEAAKGKRRAVYLDKLKYSFRNGRSQTCASAISQFSFPSMITGPFSVSATSQPIEQRL